MSKISGYSRFTCDVAGCNVEKFILGQSPDTGDFVIRSYTDENGVDREIVLCPAHAKLFDAARKNFLVAIQNLLNNKKEKVD